MSDDEQFDRWLVEAAADYNTPPRDVPREAMWAAIQSEVVAPVRAANRWRVTRWVSLAAAAVVLLAVAYRAGLSRGSQQVDPGAVAAMPEAAPLYDEVARVHFERADALLTAARTGLGADALDPAVTGWAREMLADTRLLLDSPAGAGAARRALMEDLELTLAQIVQLTAAGAPDDRRLVQRSLRGGDLLTRLRTAVPVRGT